MSSMLTMKDLTNALPTLPALESTPIGKDDKGGRVCKMPVPQQFHESIEGDERLQKLNVLLKFDGDFVEIRGQRLSPVSTARTIIAVLAKDRQLPKWTTMSNDVEVEAIARDEAKEEQCRIIETSVVVNSAPQISAPFGFTVVQKRRSETVLSVNRTNRPTIINGCKEMTHCICIRLTDPVIQKNVANFQEMVFDEFGDRARMKRECFSDGLLFIASAAYVNTPTAEEFAVVKTLVQQFVDEKVKPLLAASAVDVPLQVRVKGLEVLKKKDGSTDPTRCNVVFAKVAVMKKGVNLLHHIFADLQNMFIEQGFASGFMTIGDCPKLAILNTRTMRDRIGKPAPRYRHFNAAGIMRKYANFDFGLATVDSIEITTFSENREEGTGFYETAEKFPLGD